MNKQLNADGQSFRFRTGNGQWLTDKITDIESLAIERLRAGVPYHSVQTGALALLKLALGGVSGELVELSAGSTRIQACTSASEPPRCAAPEG